MNLGWENVIILTDSRVKVFRGQVERVQASNFVYTLYKFVHESLVVVCGYFVEGKQLHGKKWIFQHQREVDRLEFPVMKTYVLEHKVACTESIQCRDPLDGGAVRHIDDAHAWRLFATEQSIVTDL